MRSHALSDLFAWRPPPPPWIAIAAAALLVCLTAGPAFAQGLASRQPAPQQHAAGVVWMTATECVTNATGEKVCHPQGHWNGTVIASRPGESLILTVAHFLPDGIERDPERLRNFQVYAYLGDHAVDLTHVYTERRADLTLLRANTAAVGVTPAGRTRRDCDQSVVTSLRQVTGPPRAFSRPTTLCNVTVERPGVTYTIDGGNLSQMSTAVQPGDSGSPVVQNGRLVAVVSSQPVNGDARGHAVSNATVATFLKTAFARLAAKGRADVAAEMFDGEMLAGEMLAGEMSDGEMSDGETDDRPAGEPVVGPPLRPCLETPVRPVPLSRPSSVSPSGHSVCCDRLTGSVDRNRYLISQLEKRLEEAVASLSSRQPASRPTDLSGYAKREEVEAYASDLQYLVAEVEQLRRSVAAMELREPPDDHMDRHTDQHTDELRVLVADVEKLRAEVAAGAAAGCERNDGLADKVAGLQRKIEETVIPVEILTPDGKVLDRDEVPLGDPIRLRLQPRRVPLGAVLPIVPSGVASGDAT